MNTAIVTGGAKRIGAELVRALAADGWHVLIHYNRSQGRGRGARRRARQCLDRRRPTSPIRLRPTTILAALDGLPPPRLLVNNASRFVHDDISDFTPESWAAHLDVNLRAPALLSRAFAAQAGEGLIVNLLDAKLAAPNPDFFSYTISKIGLAGLTELARARLRARRSASAASRPR